MCFTNNHQRSPRRLRLLPWILFKLNCSDYPSLRYHDRNKMIFRIAWPHKSANHWTEESTRFLVDWMLYKGKLIDGEEIDFKKAKSNFRCALNSKRELDELTELRTKKFRYWQIKLPSRNNQVTKTRQKAKTKQSCIRELQEKKIRNSKRKQASVKRNGAVQTNTAEKLKAVSENSFEQSPFSPLPSFGTFGQSNLHQISESPSRPPAFEEFPNHKNIIPNSDGKILEMPVDDGNITSMPTGESIPYEETPIYQNNAVFGEEDLRLLESILCDNLLNTTEPLKTEELTIDYSNNYISNNSANNYISNNSANNYISNNSANNYNNDYMDTSISSFSDTSNNSISNCSDISNNSISNYSDISNNISNYRDFNNTSSCINNNTISCGYNYFNMQINNS